MSNELWTTQQFAQQAGLSASTISNWLRSGKLKGIKQGRKWMIPADQLATVQKAASPSAEKKASPAPADSESSNASKSYSISEFAAMTYLTELGVQRWLQAKRLEGIRQADGKLRVTAANLDKPEVVRLLRK
jgi:excisionase family DNA binding protein